MKEPTPVALRRGAEIECWAVVRQLGSVILKNPIGLLPRYLRGALRKQPRIVSTLPRDSALVWAAGISSAAVVQHAARQAMDALPQRGPIQWLPSVADTNRVLVLGSRNADLVWTPHWGIGFTAPIAGKMRTLDTVADFRDRLDAILLSDGAAVPEIVAGGRQVLETQQPLMVLDLGGLSPTEIARVLRSTAAVLPPGYVLHDSMLLPLTDGSQIEASVELAGEIWFAAIPPRLLSPALLLEHLQCTDCVSSGAGWTSTLASILLREARAGGIDPGYEPPAVSHVRFDASLMCAGFHDVEGSDGETWRWTGPAPHSSFCFARPFWGGGRITLRVIAASAPENLSELRLFVDGEPCRCEVFGGDGMWTIQSRYSSRLSSRRSTIFVHLSMPVTRQMSPDDPRHLGLCLADCLVQKK